MAALVVLMAIGGVLFAVGAAGRDAGSARSVTPAPRPRAVSVLTGGRVVARLALPRDRGVDSQRLRRALAARLPERVTSERGRATVILRYDVGRIVRRAVALGASGGRIVAKAQPVSSRIVAPVVAQAQRNACESAALEILLATTGRRIDQQRLQEALPRSGPLDPQGSGPDRVWGDPSRGYVGRSAGGGVAGGFGVYPSPVAATARRVGRVLDDLSGQSPRALYRRVLRGHAVMAWIGLSDGPYGAWRSPEGERIRVNFGEHTIVLAGMAEDGSLRVVNPLEGTSEVWSRERFEAAWRLLGRRALAA